MCIRDRISPDSTESLVTLVDAAPGVSNSLTGFTGGPSFLLPYAMSQDGIASPADYNNMGPVSFTHLRAHETVLDIVCRLLLEKKKQHTQTKPYYELIHETQPN